MFSHSSIRECMRLCNIASIIKRLLAKFIPKCRTDVRAHRSLGTVDIKRGILHGGCLNPLMVVLYMISLILVLRRADPGHDFTSRQHISNTG